LSQVTELGSGQLVFEPSPRSRLALSRPTKGSPYQDQRASAPPAHPLPRPLLGASYSFQSDFWSLPNSFGPGRGRDLSKVTGSPALCLQASQGSMTNSDPRAAHGFAIRHSISVLFHFIPNPQAPWLSPKASPSSASG